MKLILEEVTKHTFLLSKLATEQCAEVVQVMFGEEKRASFKKAKKGLVCEIA